MKIQLDKIKDQKTPFYYYDAELLKRTLDEINKNIKGFPFRVHYAIKANVNPTILKYIKEAGLGIDCVSGGELKAALAAGFKADEIVFAGVAKSDSEINAGLEAGILCFNVESFNELEVIDELAAKAGKVMDIAVRINPNIDAKTHAYITTGLNENKFGISIELLDKFVAKAIELKNVNLTGVHFHIGSQIQTYEPFESLCSKAKFFADHLEKLGAKITVINVGGGFGIDYANPIGNPIPNFEKYFNVFKENMVLKEYQELHFELGRSIVGQCGALITKVLYVKEGVNKKFVMVDAGMTDLLRPALYQAHHNIYNLTSESKETEKYDVVGPICESSDFFGKDEELPTTKRGDILALLSAGAYGEIMASQYNCRELPGALFVD